MSWNDRLIYIQAWIIGLVMLAGAIYSLWSLMQRLGLA